MSALASGLIGARGERVALCDVSVSATLRDLLGEVTVAQTYRNDETVNIEAVYTFPLPLDAVLLDLRVRIGNRVLHGTVVEKRQAEARYEDAVAAGDAAVMLEVIEPGLYTMNVGNLLPGEIATITFTYAIVYRWAADRLRIMLPTTVAPRYGQTPHAPHQVPTSSMTVENQFSLQLEITGSLRDAKFECPSHDVTLSSESERTVLALKSTRAAMDRDFVLTITGPGAARAFALSDRNGDGAAAIASFQPIFPGLHRPRPLALAIVIDCSGSMQGDSIAQAKRALGEILRALQPQDRMTIIAFGGTTKSISDRLRPCTSRVLEDAGRFADSLDADMGGTEIQSALEAAWRATQAAETGEIFLITDGEVAGWEVVVAQAKRVGTRVFTVGVGSAVSEAFVRGLAAATGGMCELVSPREGMADRIVRHFQRMRAPRASRVSIQWPGGAHDLAPASLGPVFEGDTVLASAMFDTADVCAGSSRPAEVVLEIETENGETFRQVQPIHAAPRVPPASDETTDPESISTVARLAAAARLPVLESAAAVEMALRYRLISPWTNYLVVAERLDEQKAQHMPALRTVPHTLAAGWGGTGTVSLSMIAPMAAPRMSRVSHQSLPPAPPITGAMYSLDASSDAEKDDTGESDGLDWRQDADESDSTVPGRFDRLVALIESNPTVRLRPNGAAELLIDSGLAAEFGDLLAEAHVLGLDDNVIASILLTLILTGPLSAGLSDNARAVAQQVIGLAERTMEQMATSPGLARQSALVAKCRQSVTS